MKVISNIIGLILIGAVAIVACTSKPTTTPEPIVTEYLNDLDPISVSTGFSELGRGVNPWSEAPLMAGEVIRAHGETYSNGLFAHAPAKIEYSLNGVYSGASGYVLVHDGVECGNGVGFELFADGRELFNSGVMTSLSDPLMFEVDLTGVQMLTLKVDSFGNMDCDWSIWGDPVLIKGAKPTDISKTDDQTSTPTITSTVRPTATPSPTLTPTPVPVTIQEALQRSTFTELEVFNKGQIHYSLLSYIGQLIQLSMFSPDGLQFAAVTNRGLYIYDVNSWQELFFAPLSLGFDTTSINYSVDGSLFAAGDSSGIITFWDTQTWKVQNSFQVHKGAVTSLDISPDNMNFVTIGDKKEISVWVMSDGSLIKSQFRSKEAGPAYYSLDGKWLYISEETAYRDLIIWSSEELTLTNRLGQLGRRPPTQAVSPYTNTAAAFGFRTITLYDFDTQETTKLELDVESYDRPTDMMFLDEKTLMMKIEYLEVYHLIDLESHAITSLSLEALSKRTIKNPEFLHILKSEEIKALGFRVWGDIRNITPDGTVLILSGWNEVPSGVFDLNQKTMTKADIQEFPWRDSVFLSDGALAGVDWPHPLFQPPFSNKEQQGDFTVISLNPESSFAVKSRVNQVYDVPDFIDIATISPNGKILAAGTKDGNLYLWNLDTKELIATIAAHTKVVGAFGFYGAYSDLFFDEDGSHLATWGQDRKIKVISMEDLSDVFVTNGEKPVFSPDGSHLAYISSDDSIRLVSLFDEEAPRIFRGKNNPSQIAFSPDGTLMFTGHWDNSTGIVQVWSIADGVSLLDVPQYDSVASLIVSPDGTRLYIRTTDGVISAWGHGVEK